MNQTVKALKGAGFAVLMGHHTGKSKASSYRGPSSIIMPYDSALKLTPVDAPEDPEGVTPATVMVRCEKARAGRWIKPFEAQLVRAFPTGRQWVSDVVSPALSKMQALLAVSTSKADLARRAGWDRSYVTKLEQQGVELGLFDRDEVAATLKGNKRGQAQGIEGGTSDF